MRTVLSFFTATGCDAALENRTNTPLRLVVLSYTGCFGLLWDHDTFSIFGSQILLGTSILPS